MNVAILCNSPIAVPAIELLCGRGVLAGIGIPSIQHDGTVGVRMLADARQQDLTTFDEDGFAPGARGLVATAFARRRLRGDVSLPSPRGERGRATGRAL